MDPALRSQELDSQGHSHVAKAPVDASSCGWSLVMQVPHMGSVMKGESHECGFARPRLFGAVAVPGLRSHDGEGHK